MNNENPSNTTTAENAVPGNDTLIMAPVQEQTPQPTSPESVNLHGFTEEQLADMQKFFDSQGGYEKLKARISNPQQYSQQLSQQASRSDNNSSSPSNQDSRQGQSQQPQQPQQLQQSSARPVQPPKGYASLNELSVERYFKDLAHDPKFASISEQIENGDVLKEMQAMGMTPVDENYNINVDQLDRFLTLKAASVPAKPTSVEPTNIPTVQYYNEGQAISSSQDALNVLQQSFALEARGLAPHPDKAKAEEFLRSQNGGQATAQPKQ